MAKYFHKYFRFQNGWTPLIYAAYWGQLEPIEVLLKHKVMVSFDNKVKCHNSKYGIHCIVWLPYLLAGQFSCVATCLSAAG